MNLLIGIWLIVSPWIFRDAAKLIFFWNALICGIFLVVLGLSVLRSTKAREGR
ncbi:SPW repeat protein [Rhizobium sp. BK418]|uniref:SPW repeat protein n=1 Tax=Rhizobium sp. BK418 TaxID=2512120 RepID=UPI001FE05583|nr:SPW repeat protein [Rhizobium sp. BK418]